MSGPKIVRVTSRQEREIIARQLVARLDALIAEWQRVMQRLALSDPAFEMATLQRRQELQRLLADNPLLRYDTRLNEEIAYLKHDIEQRRQQAVARDSTRQLRQRREREHARELLHVVQQRGIEMPASLQHPLRAMAEGGEPVTAALLAQAEALLQPAVSAAAPSQRQRELAERMRQQGDAETAHPWQAASEPDPRLQRIETHIAELHAWDGDTRADDFRRRLRAIDAETDRPRQNLLLDSLLLDIADAARTQRQAQEQRQELHALAVELALVASDATQEMRMRIDALPATASPEHIQLLLQNARGCLDEATARYAAATRRQAVLDGLAQLGYEVHEGMDTAWADQGRLLLRKTSTPGYGLEIGGDSGGARLQMRPVTFNQARDPVRERDVEALWCNDFSRLSGWMRAQQQTLEIERDIPLGTTPLKQVTDESQPEHRSAPGQRTL